MKLASYSVEDYGGRSEGKTRYSELTTRCHGYTISDKSDEGQDASSPVEMGNTNSDAKRHQTL